MLRAVRRAWGRRQRRRATAFAAAGALLVLPACSSGDDPERRPARATPSVVVTPREGEAQTRRDVAYAGASPTQTLDLYLPAGDGSTVFPLVVLVHGGGFLSGSSAEEADLARFLTEQGFAAASLDYRLSGEARFPAGVQDVKAALRYLHATAPSLGVDPARIAIWGFSAGGYLASMAGATNVFSTFDDPSLGHADASSDVAAVVSWYGPVHFATMDAQAEDAGCGEDAQQHHAAGSPEGQWLGGARDDDEDAWARADVTRYVAKAGTADLPPFYLVHGRSDCTVAPGQSQELHDALVARGATAELTFVDGAGHADGRLFDEQTAPTVDWLRGVLGGRAG